MTVSIAFLIGGLIATVSAAHGLPVNFQVAFGLVGYAAVLVVAEVST